MRHHVLQEPVQPHLIGRVAETAQKEHGKRLALLGLETVTGGVDASAQIGIDAASQFRKKFCQIAAVFRAANLNAVEARQSLHLKAEGSQIFKGSLNGLHRTTDFRQLPGDGLNNFGC